MVLEEQDWVWDLSPSLQIEIEDIIASIQEPSIAEWAKRCIYKIEPHPHHIIEQWELDEVVRIYLQNKKRDGSIDAISLLAGLLGSTHPNTTIRKWWRKTYMRMTKEPLGQPEIGVGDRAIEIYSSLVENELSGPLETAWNRYELENGPIEVGDTTDDLIRCVIDHTIRLIE